jgi:formate-dependent nitrite reductase membrane component NrfD
MNEALLETVHGRANPGIDPTIHIWGWEIPVYLFLGGLAAGTLILSAVMELRSGERPKSAALRMAPFLSIVLLSLGMGALFLDLEFKAHVYRFYLGFLPGSPMSWGSWILVAVYPLALFMGLGSLTAAERTSLLGSGPVKALRLGRPLMCMLGVADGRRRLILAAGAIMGVGLALYTGVLLGCSPFRRPSGTHWYCGTWGRSLPNWS